MPTKEGLSEPTTQQDSEQSLNSIKAAWGMWASSSIIDASSRPLEYLSYVNVLNLDMEVFKQLSLQGLPAYAFDQFKDPDIGVAVGAIFFGSRAYRSLARYSATTFIGKYYEVNTSKTRLLTLIPYVEGLAPLVQAGSFIKNAARKILH